MRRLALAIAVLAVGCGSATAAEGGAFVLTDGAIAGPDAVVSGEDSWEVVNRGEFNHTLVVTDGEGRVVAATDVVPPGTATTLDVDLGSGSYLVSCRLVTQDPEGNIIDHYELGMFKGVTATD